MTARSEFSRKTKAEAFARCGGFCEGCGTKLMPGKFDYDHEIPDALGGENVVSNCKVVCEACHDRKTATEDVPRIAKMKRQRDKHTGAIRPRSSLSGRSPPQRRASKPIVKWYGWRDGQ